jgi:methyltransferase (TIGR00027 family)
VPDPKTHDSKAQSEPLIRNVSDTARWVAAYRAQETQRPDAVFRDPFAGRLAGERGEKIARMMPLGGDNAWSIITRTYLIDNFIQAELQRGADLVVNLAAGLDSRPYRMQLPSSLRWVEVDLPEILDYKERVLRDERPLCALERIRLDLSDIRGRRELFAHLAQTAKRVLMITEGWVIYLTADAVGDLAADLAAQPSFASWIVDVASPALLRMLRKRMASQLTQAAPFKFAPEEGPRFFERYGWKPVEVQSLLKNAARLKRLSFFLRLVALLPENEKSRRDRPWSGVCLLANGSRL